MDVMTLVTELNDLGIIVTHCLTGLEERNPFAKREERAYVDSIVHERTANRLANELSFMGFMVLVQATDEECVASMLPIPVKVDHYNRSGVARLGAIA
jgi:hypothetical protein